MLATRVPEPAAGGALLRRPAAPEELANIRAPLPESTTPRRMSASPGIPAFEAALRQPLKYQVFTLSRTQHGFQNDTTPR